MTNLNIHKFSVDQASGNVESVTFVRDDGTLQTFSDADVNNISLEVTDNGTYIPPEPFTGFDEVTVNVPPSGKLETIDVEVNSIAQTILPDDGFDGIGEIRVPKTTLESKLALLTPDNKTYTAADDGYFGFSQVTVPGYSSLFAPCTLQDMEDAGITLGFSRTVTPNQIFGDDTTIKGFSSFQLPPVVLQAKTVTPSRSEQTIRPTDGAFGLSEVTVESINGEFGTKTITDNGTYNAEDDGYLGYTQVVANVSPNLTTLTATQNYTYTPSGYDGYSQVVVNVPDTFAATSGIQISLDTMTIQSLGYIASYIPASITTLSFSLKKCTSAPKYGFWAELSISGLTNPQKVTWSTTAYYILNESRTINTYENVITEDYSSGMPLMFWNYQGSLSSIDYMGVLIKRIKIDDLDIIFNRLPVLNTYYSDFYVNRFTEAEYPET